MKTYLLGDCRQKKSYTTYSVSCFCCCSETPASVHLTSSWTFPQTSPPGKLLALQLRSFPPSVSLHFSPNKEWIKWTQKILSGFNLNPVFDVKNTSNGNVLILAKAPNEETDIWVMYQPACFLVDFTCELLLLSPHSSVQTTKWALFQVVSFIEKLIRAGNVLLASPEKRVL